MDTLDTYDLFLNLLVLVMMPLLIWANLKTYGIKGPIQGYLWREHASFMRVCLLILAMVTIFSAIALIGYFGLISDQTEETLAMAVGILFLVASLAMIALTVVTAVKIYRDWRGGRLSA
jgi:hypothetical protein